MSVSSCICGSVAVALLLSLLHAPGERANTTTPPMPVRRTCCSCCRVAVVVVVVVVVSLSLSCRCRCRCRCHVAVAAAGAGSAWTGAHYLGELQAGKSSRNKRVNLSGSCRPVRPMKMVNRFVRQQRASCRLPRRTLIQQKGQESDLLTCIIADPS